MVLAVEIGSAQKSGLGSTGIVEDLLTRIQRFLTSMFAARRSRAGQSSGERMRGLGEGGAVGVLSRRRDARLFGGPNHRLDA
jgi:hypothetical protein